MERALALLDATVAGRKEAVLPLWVLLHRVMPANDAPLLACRLRDFARERSMGSEVVVVLEALARGGLVPEGSHPANIPSVRLALPRRGLS